MEKTCFNCHYGGCLNTETNLASCKLLHKDVQNKFAEDCEEFIPSIELDDSDIEVVTEFNVTHKCPYCNAEDIIYDASPEDEVIIECEHCGKKYSIIWSMY